MPRIFAIIELSSNEVVHTSTKYSAASGFLRSIPDRIRDCFTVVRYDANENWTPDANTKNKE